MRWPIFRGVNHQHLDRYLKEFTCRLNRRWNEDKPGFQASSLMSLSSPPGLILTPEYSQ
jgi:hypothetical protein